MKYLLFLSTWIIAVAAIAQGPPDEEQIRQILSDQTSNWNKGNLDEFMQGYWKSDSLMFIGKSGVTYGWQNTLDNYKKGYPDKTAMGTLHFDIVSIKPLSKEYYFVVGRWHLDRTIGDLSGHFTLLFRKINSRWCIIADHSS